MFAGQFGSGWDVSRVPDVSRGESASQASTVSPVIKITNASLARTAWKLERVGEALEEKMALSRQGARMFLLRRRHMRVTRNLFDMSNKANSHPTDIGTRRTFSPRLPPTRWAGAAQHTTDTRRH